MVRHKIIDLSTALSQAVCTTPCAIYGARVTTALSAHVANVEDGSTPTEVVDSFAASAAIGDVLEFYGTTFPNGCYVRRGDPTATGKIIVFYEEVTL